MRPEKKTEAKMISPFPVIGICGHSGSGKTTIISKLVQALSSRGFKVGYLKHDAHTLDVDREGKDTDVLFRSGAATVAATSKEEFFTRTRSDEVLEISHIFNGTFSQCDIVIVEGYKNAQWEKIWVHPHKGGKDRPNGIENVIGEVGPHSDFRHDEIEGLQRFLLDWLTRYILNKPLFGGLLAGGKSVRMGKPKSLLPAGGATLSEKQHDLLKTVCNDEYILGDGPLPDALLSAKRISDAPGFAGPLAGLMAAHRLAPTADWLFLAVDLPAVDLEYLQRLLSFRAPGTKFIGARNNGAGEVEPLCSVYSSQLLSAMSGLPNKYDHSINRMLDALGIKGNPALFDAEKLRNINSPDDILLKYNS
jgi:molybdopterin-guanine dinucleotide biosynthesis protein MobB